MVPIPTYTVTYTEKGLIFAEDICYLYPNEAYEY